MPLLIAGTVRVPPANVEAFRPHLIAMVTATRAEDGCAAWPEFGVSDRKLFAYEVASQRSL